jgi:dipeptidyl aminopeptidase/acylaminoacyl peptidase
MNIRALRSLALLLVAAAAALPAAHAAAPFTIQDLVRIKRLSDPQVAPDGHSVAFVLRETDVEANRGRRALWLLDLKSAGATPRRLTQDSADDWSPRWADGGRTLYFLSTRSGSAQVWRLSLQGGDAAQVTRYPLAVDTLKVAPASDRIAISMNVLPQCADLECTQNRIAGPGKPKASGQLYERLFVRHWDAWSDGTRSHLFIARIADGQAGVPVDVSGKLDGDVPSKPFGDDADFAFSPDGRTLVFSIRIAGKTEPWSTNFDLYEVPADGSAAPRNLTADNPAWDAQPVFLKSGDLAYLAMDRPGVESDRFHIVIRDARTGARRALTREWDRSVDALRSMPDGRTLLASVDEQGQHALYAIDAMTGKPRVLVRSGQVSEFAATGETVIFAWANLGAPADLYAVTLAGNAPRRLTEMNAELLAQRALGEFEQFSFPGWNGEPVHGYIVRPYGFDAGKRFPVAFIVHGGPQTAFGNEWSYRWNPQVFAGAGYAAVFVDFHGSPGYGQAFTDSISGDWGGKPLEDLQKGLAAAIARYPWLDATRVCALGASYGGFMIDWIAGKWPDRFRCLVNHDGVFEQRSMYYSTEELWFPEHEFAGPYYEAEQNYERFNPADFVTAWRTPMLVVHGGLDYRVPLSQGLGTFTALQRRGIESKLLYFPDENHWVLKPQNSILWYQTVLGWLDAHLK